MAGHCDYTSNLRVPVDVVACSMSDKVPSILLKTLHYAGGVCFRHSPILAKSLYTNPR